MARSLVPLSRKRYRITLWLEPAEYWALMHASAMLGSGKMSFHKWFKKQAQLEEAKAKAESHQHELAALTRNWGKHQQWRMVDGQRIPVKQLSPITRAKRNSPRRLAA